MIYESVLNLLQAVVSQNAAPGAALAVSRRGKLLMRESIGMAAIHPIPVPLEPDTRFDMASLTKTMATAMVAMRFVEAGLITLQDPIARFLNVPEEKKGITLHHLLTHTAGFPPHIPLWTDLDSPDEAIPLILSSVTHGRPGGQVAYSCMGYILLGKILESVGGETLDILAEKWVFGPLGMNHTGFLPVSGPSISPVPSASFASTEMDPVTGRWLNGIVHDENARFLGGVSGNAGLFSSLDDCTRFAAMLSNGGTLPPEIMAVPSAPKNPFEGASTRNPISTESFLPPASSEQFLSTASSERFLSPASFRTATRNATPGLEESRGLGFSLYDGRILSCGDLFSPGSFGHTGFTGTSIWVDADTGLSIVLLTNTVHFGRDRDHFFRLRRQLHNAIAATFPE